jgi:chemotaxis protein histidine kinase CheA
MGDIQTTNNPFQSMQAKAQAPATTQADTERSIEEVRASLIIAKQFPRDQIAAMDRILSSCRRPSLAESAIYAYPKGGQTVTGPSIRLAEAIAQAWGNIQTGIRELSQANGESTIEAFAWDVETNVRSTKTFQVSHVRHTRDGAKKLTDPRDIYELVANQGSRRLRACILALIPGDVVDSAVMECEQTQKQSVHVDEAGIKKMVDAFAEFGVSKAMLEQRIGHRLEPQATIAAELLAMKRVYTSLRDGMGKVEDYFQTAPAQVAPPSRAGVIEKAQSIGEAS